MPAFLVNWKTTVMALLPLVAYALSHFGLWPASMPLPPLDQIWPGLFAVFGVGLVSADAKK
jgi:hypothetical protein